MIQLIVPVAKTIAPYALRVAIKSGIFTAASSGITYIVDRSFIGRPSEGMNGFTNKAKAEAKYAGKTIYNSAKRTLPSAIIWSTGDVVRPFHKVAANVLEVTGFAVALRSFYQEPMRRAFSKIRPVKLSQQEQAKAERDAMWEEVEIPVFHSNEAKRQQDDGVRYEYAGEVEGDLVVDIEFSELDLAKIKRIPGKVGHEFGAKFKGDDEKVTIARHTLKQTLSDEGISGRVIQQVLVGFDREVQKTA